MLVKSWYNSNSNTSLTINYDYSDVSETIDGTLYLIRRHNITALNLISAGFLDDEGTHIWVERSDSRYDNLLKIYEKKCC